MPLKTNQGGHTGTVRGEGSTGIICLLLRQSGLPLQLLLLKNREHNTCNQPLTDLADFWLTLWSWAYASLVNEGELPMQGFFSLSGLLDYIIFHRQYGKSYLFHSIFWEPEGILWNRSCEQRAFFLLSTIILACYQKKSYFFSSHSWHVIEFWSQMAVNC